jgi:RimJ/RimL family protein N-acetyltransferase
LNNPDVNQFLEVRHKKQTQKTVHDYIYSFYNQEEKYIWGIYHNGKMIGTANLTDVDRARKIAGFGLMIGDTNYWGRLCL